MEIEITCYVHLNGPDEHYCWGNAFITDARGQRKWVAAVGSMATLDVVLEETLMCVRGWVASKDVDEVLQKIQSRVHHHEQQAHKG